MLKRTLIIMIIAALGLLTAGITAAQDYPVSSLTVDGYGQAYGAPDTAYVQLGVQVTNEDVIAAYNQTNETIETVINALVEAGIARADIQTSGLSMYQDTPYNPTTGMPGETTVYYANNSISITVRDISTVGEVISTGVAAGANNINGLSFGISDTSALEQQAREAAVADARARAANLAELTGVTLGDPIVIVESTSGYSGPQPYGRGAAVMQDASIAEGQLSVGVQVRVTFALP